LPRRNFCSLAVPDRWDASRSCTGRRRCRRQKRTA